MSYLVIARKYRPQTFDEVAGQPAVAQTLKNALRMDRIAHAYLFSGPRGVGKTSLARILARSLCCEKGMSPEPCGKCGRCVSILKGSDLDVVEIDAASNRGIDDIRELRERARVAPMLGKHKFYIVDEAHQLTNEAFNALLKILEEPPPHVLFVLATTEPERIPETIRSRCQWFEFKRVADAEIVARLKQICEAEKIEADDGALKAIARAAKGGMRDSQSLLDQVITHGGGKVTHEGALAVIGALSHETIAQLFTSLFKGDAGAVAREIERLDGVGVAAENIIDALLSEIGERMHAAATAPTIGPELDRLIAFTNLFLDARRRVRDHDDPRLALELALLRITRFGDALPIREALEMLRSGGGTSSPSPAIATAGPAVGAVVAISPDAAPGPIFDRIVRTVEAGNVALGAFLRSFRAVALRGGEIEVASLSGKTAHAIYSLADPKLRRAVDEASMASFGRVLTLREVAASAAASAGGANAAPQGTADPKVVERAMEMFEGRRIE